MTYGMLRNRLTITTFYFHCHYNCKKVYNKSVIDMWYITYRIRTIAILYNLHVIMTIGVDRGHYKAEKATVIWPYMSYARQQTDKNNHAGHGAWMGTDIEANHQDGGWWMISCGVVVHYRKWSGVADGRQRRVEKGRHYLQRLTRAMS